MRPLSLAPCLQRTGTGNSAGLRIEIINTGSELLLGHILNRHQVWLCRQLARRGYQVARQTAVPDTAQAIREVLAEAIGRADLVITTGGLGPTSDDQTRQAVAELLGTPLVEDAAVLQHLEQWYRARNREMPSGARGQAMRPQGATVLPNRHGTAPGLLIPIPDRLSAWLLMLPGPPRELEPMFLEQVLPWLEREMPPATPYFEQRLRSIGVPESTMQERVEPILRTWLDRGLEIGYCARPGEVDVRLSARGPEAPRLVGDAVRALEEAMGDSFYGREEDTIEAVVVDLLTRRGWTVATAESCTGGLLATRITDVPGASIVFRGGVIAYSNQVKQTLLGVREESLAAHGAVSEAVAREMVLGIRHRLGADYALATTGIAGPSGGSPQKPVGTVYIAVAGPQGVEVHHRINAFGRAGFKQLTTSQALEWLRQAALREASKG